MVKMSRLIPPYPGGGTLVGFYGTGMVMGFYFKSTAQPVPYVYQSRVLIPRPDQQVLSFPWQGFEPFDGVFIGSMLRPHH